MVWQRSDSQTTLPFEFNGEGTETVSGSWSADGVKITTSVGDVIGYKFLANGTLELMLDEKPWVFQRVNEEVTRTDQVQRAIPFLGTWGFSVNIQGMAMTGVQRFGADGSYESVLVMNQNGQESVIKEQGSYVDRGSYFDFNTNEGNYRQNYAMDRDKLSMEFPDLNTWIQFKRIPTRQRAAGSLGEAMSPSPAADLKGLRGMLEKAKTSDE